MSPRQQAFALVASITLLILIIELVRRRKLREEYSWLWILTGIVILVLSVWYGALLFITRLIGAVTPVSTLFMFGILFLVVTNIYYSIKISTLTTQVKNLAQRLTILDSYMREIRKHQDTESSPVEDPGGDERGCRLVSSQDNGHTWKCEDQNL
ncbi:MAG: DUF2304 domain-containing protein [Ardenticatenia bacterium]|nr:MAG: DUF2304 domain-containing protein [Ardenticatenia bacterium]